MLLINHSFCPLSICPDAGTGAGVRLTRGESVAGEFGEEIVAATLATDERRTALTEAEQLRGALNDLKEEVAEIENRHQQSLAARDKEIAELKLKLRAVNELKARVAQLSKVGKSPRKRRDRSEGKP